jgi:hypothetical protein
MPKIVRIRDHIYELPPLPTDKKLIINVDKKKDDAVWQRSTDYRDIWMNFQPYITELYTDVTKWDDNTGGLVSLNKEDSDYIDRIYKQETHRRTRGVYCKIEDELVYLPPHYYFMLQWSKTPAIEAGKEYFDYREYQRDFFYLADKAERDPFIRGLDISKAKKTGITNCVWSGIYLNTGTLYSNYNLGAMSIDQGLCAKTFRDYFMYSYNGLPSPLKPQLKSFAPMVGSLIFGESFNSSKNKKKQRIEDAIDLNTSIFCVPTKLKAFDVAVMKIIWFDEFPKYDESPEEIYRTNKESIQIMGTKNGFALLTSYTPEEDTKSFIEARKVFADSELKTINEASNGQTKTGMICDHIPSYASWYGAFNKFGKCDEKRAWDEISFGRRQVFDNKRALQALTRQYATNKKEAWMPAGAGSTFDNALLADILDDIESYPGNLYEDGQLVWDNALWESGKKNTRPRMTFTTVRFVPLTKEEKEVRFIGRLRQYETLHANLRNLALKNGRDDHKNLMPPDRFNFVGGVDPTQYAASSEIIEGSKNASWTMNMPDEILDAHYGRIASKILYSEYFYRPEQPGEFYEDLVKEIIYYGKLVIVEANVPHVATMLIEDGLGRFMLVRNRETGAICQWKPGMDYQLIRMTSNATTKDLLETLVKLIKAYLQTGGEGEKDYGRTIKSERLIDQLMNFNPDDTKKSDLVMAFGYTLLCLETYLSILLTPDESLTEREMYRSVWNAIKKRSSLGSTTQGR